METGIQPELEAFEGAWTGVRGIEVPAAFNDCTHAVIGAAMQVHSTLGPGLPERLYAAAMSIELEKRGIAFLREVDVPMTYEGRSIGGFRLDFLVAGCLVVELKALQQVPDVMLAYMVSYMRAGAFPIGLLINFNAPRLKDGIFRRLHAAALPPKPASS